MKKLNSGKPPKRCRCPQVGFKLMQDDGRVFKCYDNMWDTIFYSELGSSLSILRGGYNLDSFMARYQGVDWTEEANWECNSRRARHWGRHSQALNPGGRVASTTRASPKPLKRLAVLPPPREDKDSSTIRGGLRDRCFQLAGGVNSPMRPRLRRFCSARELSSRDSSAPILAVELAAAWWPPGGAA